MELLEYVALEVRQFKEAYGLKWQGHAESYLTCKALILKAMRSEERNIEERQRAKFGCLCGLRIDGVMSKTTPFELLCEFILAVLTPLENAD